MFVDDIKVIMEKQEWKRLVEENFINVIKYCKNEKLEGWDEIGEDELNAKGLEFRNLEIHKPWCPEHQFGVEVEYYKVFSNGKKYFYILKFYDDFEVFDDVFYVERKEEDEE